MSSFNEALFLDRVQQGLKQLLIPCTITQLEQLHTFSIEFFKWNGVHNLSAISSDEEFLGAHVMDSLGAIKPIIKAVKMGLLPSQSKIADLGVGGGFPGMLLAIFLPEFEFYLVEAIRKKTAFLQHVKGRLKLSNVKVVEQRIELFAKEQPKSMDATISRAFTELKHFIDYSVPLIKEGGIMFAMKSQKIAFELEAMSNDHQVIFNEELDIPYLDAYRCILAIQTVRKLEG